jgi:hypothetical protein
MIVGIAERMNVAHAAVDSLVFFDDVDELRAVKISGMAGLNFWISRGLDQQRHIADFEVKTIVDEQVGIAGCEDHAGFGFDLVGVLAGFDQDRDIDFVFPDCLGHTSDPGQCGYDIELCCSRRAVHKKGN